MRAVRSLRTALFFSIRAVGFGRRGERGEALVGERTGELPVEAVRAQRDLARRPARPILDPEADRSPPAERVALDAQTGEELWSSGTQIASWSHFTGISLANGAVYINTWDGMLYRFGLGK